MELAVKLVELNLLGDYRRYMKLGIDPSNASDTINALWVALYVRIEKLYERDHEFLPEHRAFLDAATVHKNSAQVRERAEDIEAVLYAHHDRLKRGEHTASIFQGNRREILQLLDLTFFGGNQAA